MLYFAFAHTILSELLYDFRLKIEEIFGAGFFKRIQILDSMSDSIKTVSELLQRKDYSLQVPALLIRLLDITPYESTPYNHIFPFRNNINYGVSYYPLVYNKTKNTSLIANIRYYSLQLELYIVTESQFLMLDIKRFLENYFPLNIPIQQDNILTLIPVMKSLYDELVKNSGWDFDNDEIYYIYRQLDYLTGKERYFMPYVINPILVNLSNEKQDKEKLSQNITARNYLSFELRTYLPINLFISRGNRIIRNISIYFNELINEVNKQIITEYLPAGPYVISKQFTKQYTYAGTVLVTKKDIIKQNEELLEILVIGTMRLKQLISQIDDEAITNKLLALIPVTNEIQISNKQEITALVFDGVTYNRDANTIKITVDLKKLKTKNSRAYYEFKKFANNERRFDLFLYI